MSALISADDVQSAELHNTRVHHFEGLLRKVLDEGGVSSSLRMAFIQGCRKTATRVAAMMVQCLPASLLLSPTAEWLAFLKGILASRTFSWQQSEVPPPDARKEMMSFPSCPTSCESCVVSNKAWVPCMELLRRQRNSEDPV
jgi:hypothetical protein